MVHSRTAVELFNVTKVSFQVIYILADVVNYPIFGLEKVTWIAVLQKGTQLIDFRIHVSVKFAVNGIGG
jgi:hypothetical protein